VAACPDCQRELAGLGEMLAALDALPSAPPSPRMRENFQAMLAAEKRLAASPEVAPVSLRPVTATPPWNWLLGSLAACALVALGFFIGVRQAPTVVASDVETQRQLAALQSQMKQMTQLVGYSLLQQQQGTVSRRMQDVLVAAQNDRPGEKVLNTLVSAVAFDPSVNVRLRALEALYGHADNQNVLAGIRASLPREENPLVQLELIDFVAGAGDGEAAPVLASMARNDALNPGVRDAARRALARF